MAGSLVAFVEPLAAGSGIPEIKTYLNGIHIKGLLAVRLMHATAAEIRTCRSFFSIPPCFLTPLPIPCRMAAFASQQGAFVPHLSCRC